jgi:predicted nucleic acid-binding protein
MSAERFTLDTNVLVYAIDARDAAKQEIAVGIVERAVKCDCPLALQVIGEFYVAAASKLKLQPRDVASRARQLVLGFETFGYSASALRAALDGASDGRFGFWDAVLLASAAEAGCTTILSEDMANAARFGSIVVANPFGRGGLGEHAQALLGP